MTAELKRKEDPPVIKLLKAYEADLARALPAGYTADRFQSVVINQIRQNKQLLTVDYTTLIASVLLAAQLGLEPGAPTGYSWIIPRKNKGRDEATFQLGYRGLQQLAYRSGQIKSIDAFVVYEGDEFEYQYTVPEGWNIRWVPLGEPGREWTHVFATAVTVLGGVMSQIMTKEEVISHRNRYAQGYESKYSAWSTDEEAMGRKTVLAKLCRDLPQSAEFREALVADGMSPRELRPDLAHGLALEASIEEEVDDGE